MACAAFRVSKGGAQVVRQVWLVRYAINLIPKVSFWHGFWGSRTLNNAILVIRDG